MRLSHFSNGRNLCVEGLPIVSLGNRGPDRLYFINMHGAGLIACPIRVIALPGGDEGAYFRACLVPMFACILIRALHISVKPIEEEAIDFRSEEHTSELQSLMRISYAVFCLKKKKIPIQHVDHKNK